MWSTCNNFTKEDCWWFTKSLCESYHGRLFCKSWVGLEFLWCPVNFILGAIIIDQGIGRICVETSLWWICLKGCYLQSNLKKFRIFYVLQTVGLSWNLFTAAIDYSWEFLVVRPIQELNMLTDSSPVSFSLQVWLPGEAVDGLGTSFVETLAQWTASATISVRETWRIVGTDGRVSRVKFEIWNPKEMPSSAEIGQMLVCWSETSWPHPLAQHGSLASPADARAVPWKLFGGRCLEFLPQTFPHVFFDQTVGTESGQCFSPMRSGEFPFMSGDMGVWEHIRMLCGLPAYWPHPTTSCSREGFSSKMLLRFGGNSSVLLLVQSPLSSINADTVWNLSSSICLPL